MRFNIKKSILTLAALDAIMLSGCEKKVDITMEQAFKSTIVSEILQNNDSVSCNISSKQNDIDIFTYFDKDYRYFYQVLEGKTSEYLVQMGTNNFVVYNEDTGYEYENVIIADGREERFYNYEFFEAGSSSDDDNDNVVSSVQKDGKIYIETEVDHDTFAEYLKESYGEEIEDGVYLVSAFTVDADTHIIESNTEYYCDPDGSKEETSKLTIELNESIPEKAAELTKRLENSDNSRKINLVLYPDTENERSYTMSCPKGERAGFRVPEECQLYTDRECTVLYDDNADSSSDITVYAK